MSKMIYPEGSFCYKCQVSSSTNPLKYCSRCNIAKYCSTNCQRTDFKTHKDDCKKVDEITKKLNEIEPFLKKLPISESLPKYFLIASSPSQMRDFFGKKLKYGSGYENVFETRIGEFSLIRNRLPMQPLSKDPSKIWPQDYLVIRMRRAEAMWRIANFHADKEGVKKVLDELIELARLDAYDSVCTYEMIAFIFLSLGQVDEAFNIVKYRILNIDLEFLVEKGKKLKPGEWMRYEEKQDIHEDILRSLPCANEDFVSLGLLTCLLAIKIHVVLEMLENGETGQNGQELGNQMDQIEYLERNINHMCDTMLPALMNPWPLLRQPIPQKIAFRGPAMAAIALQYSWQFFDKTEGSKEIILNFLDPHCTNNESWPTYDINLASGMDKCIFFFPPAHPYDRVFSYAP